MLYLRRLLAETVENPPTSHDYISGVALCIICIADVKQRGIMQPKTSKKPKNTSSKAAKSNLNKVKRILVLICLKK